MSLAPFQQADGYDSYDDDYEGSDTFRNNSYENRTNSSDGGGASEFSTDAARNLHNRIAEERQRLNERKASRRSQENVSKKKEGPSQDFVPDDLERRKSHEPDDGLASLPSMPNSGRHGHPSTSSSEYGNNNTYEASDYTSDNHYNHAHMEEGLAEDHPDYYASPDGGTAEEDQDWYDPYGSMGAIESEDEIMELKQKEAARKEVYARILICSYFALAVFTVVVITLAMLGNRGNQPAPCEELTNVLDQCSCQESLTLELSSALVENRKSILSGMKQQNVLDQDYNEPATSCEARNQAILFVADPENYPDGIIERDAQVIQRYVLALLYLQSNGNNWGHNDNWLSSLPECLWSGIECLPSETHVTGIHLNSNVLSGNMTTELGALTSLRNLDLSENGNLGGTLPTEILGLTTLRTLNLEMTSIGGSIPAEVQGLTNVEEIYLSGTDLSGSVPTSLGQLSRARVFRMKNTKIEGSINPVANMSNLEELDLSENQFSETLPSQLGQLRYLYSLDLFSNKFSGTIPSQLASMSELIYADFGFNELTGTVPSTFCALPSLDTVIIDCDDLDTSECSCCSCAPGTER